MTANCWLNAFWMRIENIKTMKPIKFSITILWVFFTTSVLAQDNRLKDTLTLQEAVEKTMKNNHGIQVARNNAQISKNNVHIGNAGMLPNLSLSSSGNYQNEDTRQEFQEPLGEQEVSGAQATNVNASLDMNYTLFDGLGNRYNYQQLKVEKDLSDAQARQTIEQTLLQVVNQYYQVARLRAQYQITRESVQLSLERLRRVKQERQYGNKSQVDVLNARVDLDSDSSTLIQARTNYENAKRSLNVLLGQKISSAFSVKSEVKLRKRLEESDLMKKAKANNVNILAADRQLKTARLQQKIAKAEFFPELSLNGSYSYSLSNNDAGFLKENQSNGVSTGLQLNIPLFSGYRNKIRAENAAIRIKNRQHQLENAELKVQRDLKNAYADYEKYLKTLRMEGRNVRNAKLNLERTRESYQLGQVNTTQLRQAQVNFIRAKTRRSNARYDAKLAEIELFKIAGLLLKEL